MRFSARIGGTLLVAVVASATLVHRAVAAIEVKPAVRLEILRRARVWAPTDIPSTNIVAGPAIKGALAPGETVTCEYVDRKLSGASPKFACLVARDDEVKVKFGRENGEVFGEVAATRLLWALGFGADAMYPVKVICRGCPPKLGGTPNGTLEEMVFDPAAIERKMPGEEIIARDHPGWGWPELDLVSEAAGGAPLAHRDALKLLAAFIQHTDSKPVQQRLVCLGEQAGEESKVPACDRPFMLISDLGLTFGRSSALNRNAASGVNFERWSRTPVWKEKSGCVANLSGSITGTLENPRISEEGRAFLAGLLVQLSDQQIVDLFQTARFHLRARAPHTRESVSATVFDWRDAFKQKRDEIVNRQCDAGQPTAR